MRRREVLGIPIAVLAGLPASEASAEAPEADIDAFLAAASANKRRAAEAQAKIAASWRDADAAMLVDLLDVVQRTRDLNRHTFAPPERLEQFLERQTGQTLGSELNRWREWIWSLPYAPRPNYGEFKGRLYAMLDPRYVVFFRSSAQPRIRLDEIEWGGVSINGIPPLDHPKHVGAAEASYLDAGDVVFGFSLDGEARAYPRRILAWHELALDRVGDRELVIVYCPLCGSVIPFDARAGGRVLTFGTSGLLYRSNKLMFDQETASLWSSLTGEPVVGPLVQLDLKLQALPVVTTTWGAWRARHPETQVLSLDTGYQRDYSEGAAYRAYFATDDLMFDVSLRDGRLPNKAEVLVVRSTSAAFAAASTAPARPFAIATALLREHPVFHATVDGIEVVVVTSAGGASRVYAAGEHRFAATDGDSTVRDTLGREWTVDEEVLQAKFDPSLRLPRLAAHRAFWFGWYAQHPDTTLLD